MYNVFCLCQTPIRYKILHTIKEYCSQAGCAKYAKYEMCSYYNEKNTIWAKYNMNIDIELKNNGNTII